MQKDGYLYGYSSSFVCGSCPRESSSFLSSSSYSSIASSITCRSLRRRQYPRPSLGIVWNLLCCSGSGILTGSFLLRDIFTPPYMIRVRKSKKINAAKPVTYIAMPHTAMAINVTTTAMAFIYHGIFMHSLPLNEKSEKRGRSARMSSAPVKCLYQ